MFTDAKWLLTWMTSLLIITETPCVCTKKSGLKKDLERRCYPVQEWDLFFFCKWGTPRTQAGNPQNCGQFEFSLRDVVNFEYWFVFVAEKIILCWVENEVFFRLLVPTSFFVLSKSVILLALQNQRKLVNSLSPGACPSLTEWLINF